ELLASNPTAFNLVASGYAQSALACGQEAAALDQLRTLHQRLPTMDLLNAMALLEPDAAVQHQRLAAQLAAHPTLSAALRTLESRAEIHSAASRDTEAGVVLSPAEAAGITDAVGRAAKPLQRYRCAACGFEAQHYFWQCPGCLGWDTYPPHRLEDL
ncbi:MAG: hypothetical protein JWP52_4485, partial [Rhizobacter sp.]|nr:hypothetical protein [Rhizobacter sp.]